MDVETIVWVAYLETVAEAGGRLTKRERAALREHRERLREVVRHIDAVDSSGEIPGQLRIFGE